MDGWAIEQKWYINHYTQLLQDTLYVIVFNPNMHWPMASGFDYFAVKSASMHIAHAK